jgi:hypothetical protein
MVLVFAFLCRSVGLGNNLWFLGKKHSQRSHPNEWTLFKTTFLYVSNITSEA